MPDSEDKVSKNISNYCFFTLLKVKSRENREIVDKLNWHETFCMVLFMGLVYQSNTKPWEKLFTTSIHKYYPNKCTQTLKLKSPKAFIGSSM